MPGGVLHRLAGHGPRQREFAALAGRADARGALEVEARAPDGLVEAFRVRDGAGVSRSRCSGIRSGRS